MKEVVTNVRTVLGTAIELGISLIAIAVIIQVLFGSTAFFGQNVVENITALVGQLGSQGIVGLLAFGVLLWVFNKRAQTTA